MGRGVLHVVSGLSALQQGAASILALLLLLTVSLADEDHDVARRLRKTGDIVPMERILHTLGRARPRAGAVRVLEIRLRQKQGHFIYNVEYVDAHGIVWESEYDAKSGTLLHTREGK